MVLGNVVVSNGSGQARRGGDIAAAQGVAERVRSGRVEGATGPGAASRAEYVGDKVSLVDG